MGAPVTTKKRPVCAICGRRVQVEYVVSGLFSTDLGRWAHLPTVAGKEADKDHEAVKK